MKNLMFILVIIGLFACNKNTPKEQPVTAEKVVNTTPVAAPAPKTVKKENGINWMTMEEAQAAAAKAPKKIIVDVYTSWCGPCKMMDRNTFSKPEVIKHINENYYAVKFNGESQPDVTFKGKVYKNPNFDPKKTRGRNSAHELTKEFAIRGYPTIKVFDAKCELVKDLVGYKDDVKLLAELNNI